MRFLIDINAGALTRWLRAMGYDAVCFPEATDAELAAIAMREGRVLVTRDRGFPRLRAAAEGRLRVVFLREQEPMAQMRQVVAGLSLSADGRAFTLCLRCNEALRDRSRASVEGLVPPFVFETQRWFKECPACGKLYWRGTHWQRMREALAVAGAEAGA